MLARLCCVVILLCFCTTSIADNSGLARLAGAKQVGKGKLSMLFWDIYEASLYAPSGKFNQDRPFALSITYFIDIDGASIADRSRNEMINQGFGDDQILDKWHQQMLVLFPDVEEGTVLTAVFVPGLHTEFLQDGKLIGVIEGAGFVRWFSGIWLSEKTSRPRLRRKLLGQE